MRKYLVWCPELGSGPEDAKVVMAHDEEDAACLWARREDCESADYWIVGGDGTTVVVRGPDGTDQHFRVTGEQAIDYRASTVPIGVIETSAEAKQARNEGI
jgi:hypothetical protein